jgi:hypothetical protein
MTNSEKIEILKSIQIVVYYVDDNRLNWIKRQIEDLNILIDVHYFKGFTPDEGKNYILSKHPEFGWSEIDTQISCTRTWAASLNWFNVNCVDKRYLITMEDDGCFLRRGFCNKLAQAIKRISFLQDEIDYVTLGYLPYDISKLKNSKVPCYDDLFWRLFKKDDYSFNIYGGQMLLFTKRSSLEIASIFHKENTDLIRSEMQKRIEDGHCYSYRAPILLGDHCLPLTFRQAIIYPPLSIEGNFKTNMGQNFNNFERDGISWSKYLNISDYYINNG